MCSTPSSEWKVWRLLTGGKRRRASNFVDALFIFSSRSYQSRGSVLLVRSTRTACRGLHQGTGDGAATSTFVEVDSPVAAAAAARNKDLPGEMPRPAWMTRLLLSLWNIIPCPAHVMHITFVRHKSLLDDGELFAMISFITFLASRKYLARSRPCDCNLLLSQYPSLLWSARYGNPCPIHMLRT